MAREARREGRRATARCARWLGTDLREQAERRLVAGVEREGAVERAARVSLAVLQGEEQALERRELGLIGDPDRRLDLALGLAELLRHGVLLVLFGCPGRRGKRLKRPVVARVGGRETPDRLGLTEPALGVAAVTLDPHLGRWERLDVRLDLGDPLLVARMRRQD